jgi:hypothetical protein
MKDWQHGVQMDLLKEIEAFYAPYNAHALSPFGKFKKNNVAQQLHLGGLSVIRGGSDQHIDACYVSKRAKMPSKIVMHGKTVIGEKMKGDCTISHLCATPQGLNDLFRSLLWVFVEENTWLTCYAGQKDICTLAEENGFKRIGYKVSSFAEITAVYFRDSAASSFGPRQHPKVSIADLVGMAKIRPVDCTLLVGILQKIDSLKLNYTAHYSNYNRDRAWSALSLRGYSPDPSFITKPSEMNDKWAEEHKHEQFALQDTYLYEQFPEVRELLSFLDGEVHRVRLMKVTPGGGEIYRHTDQVDTDAGNTLGALARLHFPLRTNDKVLFSTWNGNDEQEEYHFGFGECWILDTRKPHRVINHGTEERIHLVCDVVVTPKLEKMISDVYPI